MYGRLAFLLAGAMSSGGASSRDAAAQEHVLRGVDVYRVEARTPEEILHPHRGIVDSIRAAVASGDVERISGSMSSLGRALKQELPGYEVGLSPIQYPRGDTLAWYLTVDAVDPARARRTRFEDPPEGTVAGVDDLLEAWRDFEQDAYAATAFWHPGLTCPAWHCVFRFDAPESAARLRLFEEEVPKRADELERVASADGDPSRRAAAVFLLAHLDDPERVSRVMRDRMRDASSHVRNNAMRVLAFMVEHRGWTDIPLGPVLRMVDGPTTTDRNKALAIVAGVADDPALADRIVREAGPALVALLRLRQPNNHDFAYRILRSVSGLDHAPRDYEAWERWLASARQAQRPTPARVSGTPSPVQLGVKARIRGHTSSSDSPS